MILRNLILNIEYSKKDDFESLMYILSHLIKGSLPWESVQSRPPNFMEIMIPKMNTPPSELFGGLPN